MSNIIDQHPSGKSEIITQRELLERAEAGDAEAKRMIETYLLNDEFGLGKNNAGLMRSLLTPELAEALGKLVKVNEILGEVMYLSGIEKDRYRLYCNRVKGSPYMPGYTPEVSLILDGTKIKYIMCVSKDNDGCCGFTNKPCQDLPSISIRDDSEVFY